jgi:hypothetical protein
MVSVHLCATIDKAIVLERTVSAMVGNASNDGRVDYNGLRVHETVGDRPPIYWSG